MYSFPDLKPVCCSMSSSNCCFLTCIQISQKAGQVVWYSHLLNNFPQFVVIHTVKVFGIVNKAEVDVFLGLSCFFNDQTDVDNLISGSSAFSKSNLNIWKFTAHILLKAGLENFEHYFASVWDECNFEDIPHFKGQRRSPKMALESNPIPARDAQRAQKKPCVHQDPETPQSLSQPMFECLLQRYRSAVDCCRDRGSEYSRPGYGISPLGGSRL